MIQPSFTVRGLSTGADLFGADTAAMLSKWSLADNMWCLHLTYDQGYSHAYSEDFIKRLLNDPAVQHKLRVRRKGPTWAALERGVDQVQVEPVPCTLTTSAQLFEKLQQHGIVRPSGHIQRCMSKVTGGLAVENKLQQLYAQGDEEEEEERRETEDVEAEEEVFTPEERSEFLNRILMHLALGGSLNQYDEHIAAYKKAAIAIYKALVRAARRAELAPIQVISHVYRIHKARVGAEHDALFADSPDVLQNFVYVTVTPATKAVKLWYHAYLSEW